MCLPCRAKCGDDQAIKLTTLLFELARSADTPKLVRTGAMACLGSCVQTHPCAAPLALELGIFVLITDVVRPLVGSAVWAVRYFAAPAPLVLIAGGLSPLAHTACSCCSMQSISGGRSHEWFAAVTMANGAVKRYQGESVRPDIDAAIASGLLDVVLEALSCFADRGLDRGDTSGPAVYVSLGVLRDTLSHPTCREKIRHHGGPALAYCMENDLIVSEEIGLVHKQSFLDQSSDGNSPTFCKIACDYSYTTGNTAAQICECALSPAGSLLC